MRLSSLVRLQGTSPVYDVRQVWRAGLGRVLEGPGSIPGDITNFRILSATQQIFPFTKNKADPVKYAPVAQPDRVRVF